jgi:ketosteroid isomerase-like protein
MLRAIVSAMSSEAQVRDTEGKFFAALKDGDVAALDRLLAPDFTIIDVMRGAEVPKAGLLDAVRSGVVKFEKISLLESRVRFYQQTAVVTGRTQMTLRSGPDAVTVASRYTHVYVEEAGGLRLAAAQGTQIVE